MRFKERNHLYNIKLQGEAAGTDAVASYPEDQIINDFDYNKKTDFQSRWNSLLLEEDITQNFHN